MTSTTPIACTLSPAALGGRTAWIGALNRSALRSLVQEPTMLTLTYAASAEPDLRELVRLERECCAFLAFELGQDAPDTVTLRIRAPEGEGTEHLLAPFLSGVDQAQAGSTDVNARPTKLHTIAAETRTAPGS